MAKLRDVIEEMKTVLADAGTVPELRFTKILDLAADFLCLALAKDMERGQAAVLMLVPEDSRLTFVYPQHLAGGNSIPLSRDSFAGRVVLEQRPLLENRVSEEPHKDVFERIPGPSGKARQIHKMIAAPIFDGSGKAVGVVEVSRTGDSPGAAGEDFKPVDVQNLEKCCRAFAPFVVRSWSQAH